MLESLPVAVIIGTVLGFLSGLGIGGGSLLILWLTAVLHTGLTPAALSAALTLRAGQEKLVAKKRA